MSVAKHYTEWSREDKDALASQRMEEMKKKNEEIKRRRAEVDADRMKAEEQNSSVTLAIKANAKFHEDSRNRESGYEDSHDVSRRNFYNSGSKDFRNSRQGVAPRKAYEKGFVRGSNMSPKERADYEKWKAEREKIDEDRIARHKVQCEWDKDKVEQEPDFKPLPSKFYREPSWISKQDDWPQRREFNQRVRYRGNDGTHFKNPRCNYESEDANWQDKSNKSYGRSRTKDSSFDKPGRASLSDDEDNRYSGRRQKFDSSNNHSSSLRKNQDATSGQNFHFRTRGGGFSQGSQNDYGKPNSTSLTNQNNSSSRNASNINPVRTSRAYNSSDNCFDKRNDGQDVKCKSGFQGNDDTHAKSRATKQNSGTWSSDEETDSKTSTAGTVQKNHSSRSKQSSGNWSDDDSTHSKTKDWLNSVKRADSFSKCKQSYGDTWSDGDTTSHINSAQAKSKPKQSSGTWSDDDDSSANAKTKTSVHTNNNSFPKSGKKTTGDTWSDDEGSCIKRNPQVSQKDNSVTSQTKQASGTWSDDDSINVKQHSKLSTGGGWCDDADGTNVKQHSKLSTGGTWSDDDDDDGTNVKHHSKLSTGGEAWSDIDDDGGSTHKSRNDNAWLDMSDKNENRSSNCGRSRKWNGKQPPINFPVGRERKWSFEPSRQYRSESKSNSYNDYDEQRSENRAITLGTDDNLTVTVSGVSNDIKGNRPFSDWGVRNSGSRYKNTGRPSQVLNRSFSDPDKHQAKHDEPNRGFQQNSRNFRGRGSSFKRGNFNNTGFQKSNFEDAPQQKFRDSVRGGTRGGRGGFRHSNNFSRGARRSEETRRCTENHETQNRSGTSQKNESMDDGWGDVGKEKFAAHSEDIGGDAEGLENANLSPEWIDDNTGDIQCLKSKTKTEDGWRTGNCGGSSLQSNDDSWKFEDFTHSQMKEESQMDNDKNSEGVKQSTPDVLKSHENTSVDTKRSIHEAEHSPLHECVGNESHDDSSWVTITSGEEFEEELREGEYIDDEYINDESSHISSKQQHGEDTSSPEPEQHFVCSMKEYLSLTEAAGAYNAGTQEVCETEKSEVLDITFCSSSKLRNSEMENTLLCEKCELSNDHNSRKVLPVLESESDGVIENLPHSDVILSSIGDDQKYLSEARVEETFDKQLPAENHYKNTESVSIDEDNQKMVPEMQGFVEQLAVSSALPNPISTDENYKTPDSHETSFSHLESTYEKSVEMEDKNISVSSDHSESGDLSLCCEMPCNSGVANEFSDFTSAGSLHNNCVSSNAPQPAEFNETTSSVNIRCSNTSEELSESNEFQDSTVYHAGTETNIVCNTSSDSASCDDIHGLPVVPPEDYFSESMCRKQEDGIGNHVISSSEHDKTEVENESHFTTQHTDISNSTVHDEIPIQSGENLDASENVPTKGSVVSDLSNKEDCIN